MYTTISTKRNHGLRCRPGSIPWRRQAAAVERRESERECRWVTAFVLAPGTSSPGPSGRKGTSPLRRTCVPTGSATRSRLRSTALYTRACRTSSTTVAPVSSGTSPSAPSASRSTSRSATGSSREGSMSAWSMCSRPGAREDFRSRMKKNDQLKAEAKACGEVISTKRQPEGPKPGFMVEGATLETVTPIPYDVVNDLKGG
ncbi:unnamed protein product [Musa acuminata subsp. malaccensis]|uniref:(wild Malaysian banana) hypothetical protein n=1 Tax=Musa acuminata subsp. malaccensis TaxID=214687 RepID=A0A804IXX4_MUSAM|nr:unnamed protein product [Musa acuminata subsp. malaccensis]